MSKPIVTIFGSARPAVDTPAYQLAYELGHAIAGAGWAVCNGGYGGTMEASARGAADAGGHTIGVTCAIFRGRVGANPYVRQEIPTFDLHARLNTLVRLGRAYVVLPGGTGTLLELALVWELLNKKLLEPMGTTMVLVGEHWRPVCEPIFAEQPDAMRLPVARDVAEAMALLRPVLDAESGSGAGSGFLGG